MESSGTPAPDDHRLGEGPHAARRLTRARGDRVLAGVCEGLARYYDKDATLVRAIAVVLVLFGGAGLLAYGALWLLVPEEPANAEAADQTGRPITAGMVVLIAALLIVGSPFIIGGGAVLLGVGIPLAIAGLAGLTVWWLVSGEPFFGTPLTTLKAAVLGLLVLAGCMLLLATGFLGTGLGGGAAAGGVVIAAGVVLVAGAFAGKVRWVALPALALAIGSGVAAASQLDISGGAGQRDYRPTSTLPAGYELGMGQLVVDLRGATLPAGDTPLKLRVGMGQAVVIVPRDVCVATQAKLGAGGLEIFRNVNGGFDYTYADQPKAGPANKRLLLDANVGFGQLVVSHDRQLLDEGGPRPFDHDTLRAPGAPGNTGCARA